MVEMINKEMPVVHAEPKHLKEYIEKNRVELENIIKNLK